MKTLAVFQTRDVCGLSRVALVEKERDGVCMMYFKSGSDSSGAWIGY